jgi:hypothetical protein
MSTTRATLLISFFCSFVLMAQDTTSYTRIWPFQEGLARVEKNGWIGFVDTKFNEVIPCRFAWANNFSAVSGLASFTDSNGIFGFINRKGEIVAEPQYKTVYYFQENCKLVYVSKNGKYGWVDAEGKEFIPCIYDQTVSTPEHFYGDWVRMKLGGKYGLLDINGHVVLDFEYDWIDGLEELVGFNKDFLTLRKDKEYSFMNVKTGVITVVPYDYAGAFSQGRALVKIGKSYGYIDTTFNLITPLIYKNGRSYREGFAAVQDDSLKWSFIDFKGNKITDLRFDAVKDFRNGLAEVGMHDPTRPSEYYRPAMNYGYINTSGQLVLDFHYMESYYIKPMQQYRHFALCKDSSCVLMDYSLKPANDEVYEGILLFDQFRLHADIILNPKNNYAIGFRNKLCYSLDSNGREINTIGSKRFIFFNEGLALIVDENDKAGYINTKGKVKIPLNYEYYDFAYFLDGHALIQQNGKLGIINKRGKVIIPFVYETLSPFSDGFAVGKRDGRYEVINKKGKVVFEVGSNK